MIRIEIKRRCPSGNLFANRRGYMGSRAYSVERDVWMVLLRAALRPRVAQRILVRASLTSFRSLLLDYQNLVAGAKAIPDCLIRLGYLYDDAPAYFSCTYEQVKCRRVEERTVLSLINL